MREQTNQSREESFCLERLENNSVETKPKVELCTVTEMMVTTHLVGRETVII